MFYNKEETDKFQRELCLKLWRLQPGNNFQRGLCVFLPGNCKQVDNLVPNCGQRTQLREMKFFWFCWCRWSLGWGVVCFGYWFFVCLGFGFVWVGWFFTVIELHHCEIWIPSLLASRGVIFSLYILKNAFMINTNWCELCSHRLLFPTFIPELKKLCRIFWEFPVFRINNWGWGSSVSFLTEELW